MADYNLLNGLFASPTSSASRASSTSLTCQLGTLGRVYGASCAIQENASRGHQRLDSQGSRRKHKRNISIS